MIITIKFLTQFYSKKFIKCLIVFLVLQNVFILSFSFFSKYNSTLVRNNFISNFKKLDEPKSGLILILTDQFSYQSDFNYIFFESYKASKWFSVKTKSNEFKDSNLNFYFKDVDKILNNSNYKIQYMAKDYEYNCITIFRIYNDLSSYNLINKLYLFNQEKYFKIQKVSEHC